MVKITKNKNYKIHMNCKPLVGIAISFTLDTTDINMKLNMDMDGFSYRQKRREKRQKDRGA